MLQVIIIGSGLAGCATVRALRQKGYGGGITVISPTPSLFYYPGLSRSLLEMRVEDSLTVSLSDFFDEQDVDFLQANVVGINPEASIVKTDITDIGFDYLVIASGHCYLPSIPGSENTINPLQNWTEMRKFQRSLNELEGGSITVGFDAHPEDKLAFQGGPVFDLMLAVDRRLRDQGKRDAFDLTFISPLLNEDLRFVDDAFDNLMLQLKRNGINFVGGQQINAFEKGGLITDSDRLASDLTAFTPGFSGSAWVADSGLAVTGAGIFEANKYCQSPGHENIYLVGGAGHFADHPIKSKHAYIYGITSEIAAKNITASSHDQMPMIELDSIAYGLVNSVDNNSIICRGKQRNYIRRGIPLSWSRNLLEWQTLRRYNKAS